MSSTSLLRAVCQALVVVLPLAACGGGGGSGGSNPTNPSLRYAVGRIEAAVGVPFELTPVASQLGNAPTFSVTPALPAGLALDAATGRLAGTPTAVADAEAYIVRAGGTTATFDLRVSLPSRYLMTASGGDGTLLVQGLDAPTGATRVVDLLAKPLNLPAVTDLAECANPPVLVAVHGAATEVGTLVVYDVATDSGALTERGRASLGFGPHRVVLAPGGDAAYVTDHTDDVVRAFALPLGSAPTALGTPFATGNGPEALAVVTTTSGTEVLVVANRLGQSLSSFRIDPTTRALSTTSGALNLNGGVPSSVASAGDGQSVIVVLENFALAVTARVDASGDLQSVFGGAQTGLAPSDAAVNPAGDVVLVANAVEGSVTVLSRSPGDSGPPLTEEALVTVQAGPTRVRFDLAGRFAYVASASTGEVTILAIRPEGSPRVALIGRTRVRAGVSALTTFEATTPFSQRLGHLYVLDGVDEEVTVLAPTGGAAETLAGAGAPLATASGPVAAVVAPAGDRLFVVSETLDQVDVYPLTQGLPGLPVTSATATAPIDLAVAAGGRVVAVVSQSPPLVTTYRVDGAGALTQVDVEALPSPTGHVAIDPTGQTVIATSIGTGQLVSYRINPEGFLTGPITVILASGVPRSLGFSRDGRFVVTGLETQDRLALYAHGADGSLVLVPPAAAGGNSTGDRPVGIAFHPTGEYVLAAVAASSGVSGGSGTGALEVLRADRTSGALSQGSSLVEGLAPSEVLWEPRGRVAYALNTTGRDLSVVRFDPASGALTALTPVPLGNGPRRLAVRELTN